MARGQGIQVTRRRILLSLWTQQRRRRRNNNYYDAFVPRPRSYLWLSVAAAAAAKGFSNDDARRCWEGVWGGRRNGVDGDGGALRPADTPTSPPLATYGDAGIATSNNNNTFSRPPSRNWLFPVQTRAAGTEWTASVCGIRRKNVPGFFFFLPALPSRAIVRRTRNNRTRKNSVPGAAVRNRTCGGRRRDIAASRQRGQRGNSVRTGDDGRAVARAAADFRASHPAQLFPFTLFSSYYFSVYAFPFTPLDGRLPLRRLPPVHPVWYHLWVYTVTAAVAVAIVAPPSPPPRDYGGIYITVPRDGRRVKRSPRPLPAASSTAAAAVRKTNRAVNNNIMVFVFACASRVRRRKAWTNNRFYITTRLLRCRAVRGKFLSYSVDRFRYSPPVPVTDVTDCVAVPCPVRKTAEIRPNRETYVRNRTDRKTGPVFRTQNAVIRRFRNII